MLALLLAGCANRTVAPDDSASVDANASLMAEPTPSEWTTGPVWHFVQSRRDGTIEREFRVRVTDQPEQACSSGDWRAPGALILAALQSIAAGITGTVTTAARLRATRTWSAMSGFGGKHVRRREGADVPRRSRAVSLSRSVGLAVGVLVSSLLPPAGFAQVDGSLDPAFGSPADAGRIAFSIVSRDPADTPGSLNWAQVTPFKVLPRRDGSAIVWSNAATPYDLPISAPTVPVAIRIRADGTWDTTWGASGGGRTVIYVGEDYNWRAADAVTTADGGMAVVGTIDNPDGSSDIAVWRFLENGQIFAGFGTNGLRRLRRGGLPSDAGKVLHRADLDLLGQGFPSPDLLIVGANIRDGLMGVHDLGLIIMDELGSVCPSSVAACGNVVGGNVGSPSEWRMLRLGSALCPNGGDVDVADLTKFDAGVSDAIPVLIRGCGDTAVVKHTIIGNVGGSSWGWTTNTGYANSGRSLVTFGTGFRVDGNAIVHAPLPGVALGSESLVIAGARAQADGSQPRLMAARLDRTSFTAATYDADPPGDPWTSPGAYADALLVQPDGKLILGGGGALSSWTFGDGLLMRLNADLSPDAAFGNLSVSLPGRQLYGYPIGGTDRDNRVNAMALTADGKLLLAGYVYASNDGNSRYGSVMRVRLQGDRLFTNGFDPVPQ